MKVRHLMELIQDSKDITDLFDGVETPEQMVSALERLKKREAPEEFLAMIQTLRISCEQISEDTLEMSGFEPDEKDQDDNEGDDLSLGDLESLESLGEEEPSDNQNPSLKPLGEEVKKVE